MEIPKSFSLEKNTHHPSYIPALDGLRGIAVLLVMFFHFFQFKHWSYLLPWLSPISKISEFGQTGVDLFFVLSGFLITRILLSTKNTEGYFKKFYIRRTLRIFPLYYAFLIFLFYILPFLQKDFMPSVSTQLWHFTYLQNIPATFADLLNLKLDDRYIHLWSLAVEEHFYLVFPWIVFFMPVKHLQKFCVGLILFSIILRIALINIVGVVGIFYFTPCRFDGLAMGALLACIEYTKPLSNYKKNFLYGTLLFFSLLIVMWTTLNGKDVIGIQIVKYTILAALYASILGYLASTDNIVTKIIGNKTVTFTGKISYGLYIFHPVVYSFMEKSNNFFFALPISFLITYLLAIASFEVYEKRFLKLKKYFE